jgi:hypothetical protein
MASLGKLIYKQLTSDNVPQIEIFCEQCKLLGYENNASLKAMKFEFATFFGAYDQDKIVSLAGVHPLPEVNKHAWRCLFRGAQLPRYTPEWSMNIFKSGIHFSQFLYRQIKYVQSLDKDAEFYVSTNITASTGVKSHRMNNVMMPRIANMGVWHLYAENIMLYNVPQNLWKIDVDRYLQLRNQYLE